MNTNNEIHIIKSEEDLRNVIWNNPSDVKIVKVGASWCSPCQKIAPGYVKLSDKCKSVEFYTMDVSDRNNSKAWDAFRNMGGEKIPYFTIYKNYEKIAAIQTSDISMVERLLSKHDETSQDAFVEPLLKEDIGRLVLFPIKNKPIWDMYKKHESTFWTAEELDLSADRQDFETKLTDNERHFVEHVLAFFAASDAIVNENLVQNFMDEVQSQEARCFYGFQVMIESIHSEVYSLLIDTLIADKAKKEKLFRAIETVPIIKKKAEWCFKWTNRDHASFAERLVAFAIVEGIFFSGSFCAIYWLKKRGLLPGTCTSNELISRDEGLHCDFACLLYSQLVKKLPKERVYEIMDSAVKMECEFVSDALPVSLIGMNSESMCQYIRFCADRLLYALGYDKFYKDSNPFEWMELLSMQRKVNFFEARTTEYAKAGVCVEDDEGFSLDADF